MRAGLGSPRRPDANPKESLEPYLSRAKTYADTRDEHAPDNSERGSKEVFNKRLNTVLQILKNTEKPLALSEIWNAVSDSKLFNDKSILQSFLNTASFQKRILKLSDPQRPDTRNKSYYLFSAMPESGTEKSNP